MKVIHNNTAIVAEFLFIDDDGDVVRRERPQVVVEKLNRDAFIEAYEYFDKLLVEFRNATSDTSDRPSE